MEDSPPDFAQLMQRVRAGCPEAQRELIQRFGPHIRRLVRQKLHSQLRRRYDSEDFTQDVWASFFQTATHNTFDTPGALVRYLSRMTCHKVMDTTRERLHTLVHGSAYADSLDAPHPEQRGVVGDAVPAACATPSEEAMAGERWRILTQGLLPGHLQILELLRDGHSHADIVRRFPNLNRYAVEHLIKMLSRRLETS
jgi:DNA-directed RNA polymerase specialized sigma24 family protein